MSTPLAVVTLQQGERRQDVAVPTGTTVAGLLAMLRIDPAGNTVTLPDGSPPAQGAVLGRDLPSGVLLAVTGEAGSREYQEQQRQAEGASWYAEHASATAFLVFVTVLELTGFAAPAMLGAAGPPAPLRWALAAFCVVAVLALMIRSPRWATSPAGALGLPLLVGLPVLALVPAEAPAALPIAVAAAAWTAFLTAAGCWLITRRETCQLATSLWGLIAAGVSLGTLWGAAAFRPGPVLLALGAGLVAVVPHLSMKVPETQLVDLPALATAASSIRSPEAPPPSRISNRRVRRTVGTADGRAATLTLAGTALAVIGVVWAPLAPPAAWDDPQWLGTLAALAAAVLVLCLAPRKAGSRLVRMAPRLGAAALVVVAAARLGFSDAWPGWVVPAAVLVGAVATVLAASASTAGRPSPLLGHLADAGQRLALVSLAPAAAVGSGLLLLVWRLAS